MHHLLSHPSLGPSRHPFIHQSIHPSLRESNALGNTRKSCHLQKEQKISRVVLITLLVLVTWEKSIYITVSYFHRGLRHPWLPRQMKEACLCREQVNNLRASASAATTCNSPSFTPLSHSLSMAWQSLSHQASCDSLPVPALHLHSLWCHGRFSFWRRTTEHTPRLALNTYACTCVFTCGHPSVRLAKTSLSRAVVNAAFYSFSDDVFHKVKGLF